MKPILLSLALTTSLIAAPDASWSLKTGEPWQLTGSVKGNQDLSAIDSLNGKTGLLASDEGSAVQSVSIDGANRVITAGESFKLLGKKQEADIEGIAAAPAENCYYITGSHAISRKKLQMEESRYHIYRMKPHPVSGALSGQADQGSLRKILESVPELKTFLDQPAHANGIDIEGLTWKDGRLFIGFRAPVGGENAWVLETTGAAIFEGAAPEAKLHVLPLGKGTGIRALATIRDGLLILTGDSGTGQAAPVPGLFYWTPGAEPVRLGDVPAGGAKPEAMMVLSESDTGIRLVMISDGLTNGNPVTLTLTKGPAT